MVFVVRLWFLWPLACLLSAIAASPFYTSIRTGNSWGQWIYLSWLCTLAAVCLFLLLRAVLASLKSVQHPGFRRQGFIALTLIGLFLCVMFPFGLAISIVGFGGS